MKISIRVICILVLSIIALTGAIRSYSVTVSSSEVTAAEISDAGITSSYNDDAASFEKQVSDTGKDQLKFSEKLGLWVNNNVIFLLILLFLSAGVWLFFFKKFVSANANIIMLGVSTLLFNLCAMLLTYAALQLDALSFKYVGKCLLLIPLILCSVGSVWGISTFWCELFGINESKGLLFIKIIIGGGILCGVIAVIEMLIEGGLGRTSLNMTFTSIYLSIYALVMIGIGIYYAIAGAKGGHPRFAIFGGFVTALSSIFMGLSIMLFCIYILFFVLISIIVILFFGIKRGGDTIYIVDQYGNKIYGRFVNNNVFKSVGGKIYRF
ncbi:MAG: hypothetical protein J1E63_10685 [Muribaculaceae bacterium]|nr:hypothetical protein [Muribaculaceae bacterium]